MKGLTIKPNFNPSVLNTLKSFANVVSNISKLPSINIEKFSSVKNEINFDTLGVSKLKEDEEFIKPKRFDSLSSISNLVTNIEKIKDNTTIVPKVFNKSLNTFHECLQYFQTEKAKTFEQRSKNYSEISNISNSFLNDATQYGKIIIREIGVPFEEKTIKPINKGG
jgi:hypothetical protein